MKVPLSWLRDYVDVDPDPRALADRLTFSGLEVEAVREVGGDYPGVVVGEVRSVERHPNADRLTVCRVFDGQRELVVVCGAPNVCAGQKVPLAQVGARLPNGMGIKSAKVRGVVSEGMLCAEDELRVSDDHSGLMILPANAAAGTPLAEVLGGKDVILEIEVTPNRPDCLSLIGVAREVATLYGIALRWPSVDYPEGNEPVERATRIEVQEPDGCPRYTARILSGVTIAPSPLWMQQRLARAGVRPINNVVDITNYVMLECGQPLHAFDQALLHEGRIVVRRAQAGERMATLDGIDRPIDPAMLMICAADRPVAVAGVMGGAGSEISDATRTVLLESACFKPSDIRKTSKRLGLMTESSYRFERGVDIGRVDWASRRAAGLMVAHAGAAAARGVVDVFLRRPAPMRLTLRYERARDLLGTPVSDADMDRMLNALEVAVVGHGTGTCAVAVPSFRPDLTEEADLIEEIARINGLDKVPAPSPSAKIVSDADDRAVRAVMAVRGSLVGLGLMEVMNYSFLAERLLTLVGCGTPERRIVIPNPVTQDHAVLRDALVPQMLETIGRNHARQVAVGAFFELGRVFFKRDDGRLGEEERVCVGLMGPVGRMGMAGNQPASADEMFAWIKGLLEQIETAVHLRERGQAASRAAAFELRPSEHAFLEPGRRVAVFCEGQECGVLGLVAERLRAEWRLTAPVAVLEIQLAPLLRRIFRVPAVKPVGAYPGVSRDMALVVPQHVRHESITACIWQCAPAELSDVRLFDVYAGQGIPAGHKSMAYSLFYRSPERTLTDEEANTFRDSLKAVLRRDLGAEVREG